jgi:hypothetical protein
LPSVCSRAEVDVRGMGHDIGKFSHEKDFRTFVAHPPADTRDQWQHFIRVGFNGKSVDVHILEGTEYTGPCPRKSCSNICGGWEPR